MLKIFIWTLILAICIGALSPGVVLASNSAPIRLGILGDSNSDEYRADDNRGGFYAATTLGWNEQLSKSLHWDIGAWGTRKDVRRTGFEYNWARTGADSFSLLTDGQHTGLAAQIREGKIDVVILTIGSNDFAPYYSRYQPIYEGTLSGAALEDKLNQVLSNILVAADTVLAAGNIKLVVGGVPDWGLSPNVIQQFPDAMKRQRVSNAMLELNTNLKNATETRGGLFLDQNGFGETELLSKIDAQGNLHFADQLISATSVGDEPHHLQLGDNIHSGTVIEGLLANYYVYEINQKWQLGLPEMSADDILINAGIKKPGCSEDLDIDSYVDLTDYSILSLDLLSNFPRNSRSDINHDNSVDLEDYSLMSSKFLQQCVIPGPYDKS